MGKKKIQPVKQEEEEEKYPLNEWGLRGTELYLHQQNNIKKMEFQEANKERIYKQGTRTIKTYSTVGILHDKVGSGKTLTMVSFLSREKQEQKQVQEQYKYSWVIDMGSNHYFTYTTEEELSFKTIPINIIVVSSSIHNQWGKELSKTNLKYKTIIKYVIKKKKC